MKNAPSNFVPHYLNQRWGQDGITMFLCLFLYICFKTKWDPCTVQVFWVQPNTCQAFWYLTDQMAGALLARRPTPQATTVWPPLVAPETVHFEGNGTKSTEECQQIIVF